MIRRTLLVTAAVLTVTATTILTTAASASPAAARTHLRTVASARSYLASLGIDPSTVVIQRGARVYAGPRCPGRGWTCTRATRVFQLGTAANKVDCGGGTPSVVTGQQGCTIVQNGSNNSARCFERSTDDVVAQDCNITQTGNQNTAIVDQAVEANGGPAQNATQTAEVTQSAGAGGNSLSVKQHVHQHVQAGDPQTQDTHQELNVSQTATGSGNNSSDVKQDQNLDAHNASTAQAQDTNPSSSGTPCPAATLFGVGSDPNQCAFVSQNADAGDNSNSFDQSVSEDAHSNAGATQTQGSFEGGIKAQAELVSATGTSTDSARQSKSQSAFGGSTQTQIDPMSCCGTSASGDDQSSETLDQSSSQSASGPFPFQNLDVLGFVHTPTGGSCSITQHVSDNADSSSANVSLPSCETGLGEESFCTSGGDEAPATDAQQALGACESEPFNPTPE